MRALLIGIGAVGVGLIVGGVAGWGLHEILAPPAPVPGPQTPPTSDNKEIYLSTDEVLGYLDGKVIDPANLPRISNKPPQPLHLARHQIDVVQVQRTKNSINGGPDNTPVMLIFTTDQGRYAATILVAYRRVENQCAFFGFEVEELAKQ